MRRYGSENVYYAGVGYLFGSPATIDSLKMDISANYIRQGNTELTLYYDCEMRNFRRARGDDEISN